MATSGRSASASCNALREASSREVTCDNRSAVTASTVTSAGAWYLEPALNLVGMPKPRIAAGRARETSRRLGEEYPGSAPELCELRFADPFQLLVATILSAQTTDERVNAATPGLFDAF